jgi:hypothetical protein
MNSNAQRMFPRKSFSCYTRSERVPWLWSGTYQPWRKLLRSVKKLAVDIAHIAAHLIASMWLDGHNASGRVGAIK